MFTEGESVLHMVDDETHLSAAQFVEPFPNNLSGTLYLRYGHPFTLDCQTHKLLMMAHNSEKVMVEICEIHDIEW